MSVKSFFKKAVNKPVNFFKKSSGAVESMFKKGSNVASDIAQGVSTGLGKASDVLKEGQGALKSSARVIEKVSTNPLVRAGISSLPYGSQALMTAGAVAQGLRQGGKLLGQGSRLAGQGSYVTDVSSYKKSSPNNRVDTFLENVADAKRRLENKSNPVFA